MDGKTGANQELIRIIRKFSFEAAMVQRHLECDRILRKDNKDDYVTECISQLIAKVSRNMSFHHACSRFMNNIGQEDL
jgi:hypothetical protein